MATDQLGEARIGLISPLTEVTEIDESGGGTAMVSEHEDRWSQVIDDLLRLRQLGEDWDGQGASALDAVNVDSAIAWAQHMRRYAQAVPPTQVVPGVTGEVSLVWQGLWQGKPFFLEAEISTPRQVEWMLAIPDQPTKQWVTDRANLYFVGPVR